MLGTMQVAPGRQATVFMWEKATPPARATYCVPAETKQFTSTCYFVYWVNSEKSPNKLFDFNSEGNLVGGLPHLNKALLHSSQGAILRFWASGPNKKNYKKWKPNSSTLGWGKNCYCCYVKIKKKCFLVSLGFCYFLKHIGSQSMSITDWHWPPIAIDENRWTKKLWVQLLLIPNNNWYQLIHRLLWEIIFVLSQVTLIKMFDKTCLYWFHWVIFS